MPKNEFAELFKGLTNEEFSQFGKFIRSPFFDVPNRIVKLFGIIENKFDTLTDTPLTREEISGHFYPGKSFGDTQLNIRKLISEFKKYYNGFLSELEFSRQKFQRDWFLLKQLAKREKYDEFDKEFDKANIEVENRSVRDEEYYLNKIQLLAEAYRLEGTSFKKFENDLAFKIQELIDLYYYSYKMYLFQRIENKTYVMNRDLDEFGKLYYEIIKDVETGKDYYQNHPEIYARYLTLLHLNTDINLSEFDKFLEYLKKTEEDLRIDCYYFYTDVIFNLIRQINKGKYDYEPYLLKLAEVLDIKGSFKNHGISSLIFKSIIESAIGGKRYDWGLDFIQRNRQYIEIKHGEGYVYLSYAKLYFFKREFQLSRKYLGKVNFEDFYHYVDAKLIEARIEIELENYQSAISILETVSKYLKAHKEIASAYKNAYQKFINYTSRLIKLYEQKTVSVNIEYDTKRLKEDLINDPGIPGHSWLNEKAENLRQGI